MGATKKYVGPDWEEARSVEKSAWRLEPEGEMEVTEINYHVGCGRKHLRGP